VITVVVRDAEGNPIAGQNVALNASGAGVSLTQPGATDATGRTTAQFSATGSGDHVITAVASGVTLGSKTITVTPGPALPGGSTADVPAGTAGIETAVTVRLQDGFGNPVTGAGAQVSMAVSGANSGAKVEIDEAGGGAYLARYTPTKVGSDLLDLRVAGQPIPGSPFASSVLAGPADPEHTTAEVPKDASFGVAINFVVQAADAFGNPLGRGGDVVVVTPAGLSPIPAADQGDGTYRATWVPFTLGTVNVTITINGNGIHHSPFPIRIQFLR